MNQLTATDLATLRSLDARGFAVCVFTPDEIGESSPEQVCEAMNLAGQARIDYDNVKEF